MSEVKQEYNPQVAVQGPPGYPVAQQYPSTPGSIPGAPVPVVPVDNAAAGQAYRDQLFAQCAQGNHERKTEYGMCGIITAIACFPCGLICLFSDSQEKCSRCGVSLEKR
ncbi:hypothetical protein B0H34DRAFT_675899 [Crassisporium funariophilum]|nr:hypothetical protein B0H34DRAFT_675899 [Crassisporium funariophilum]